MNRGIAKRPVFETKRDVRKLEAELAWEVRAGRLEVHAFAILTTHFHLLVRSPRGELSEAMRRIQNGYVRWFNRSRRRDGPLFRGRFRSRLIETDAYREAVLWYVDRNAVEAGIVAESHLYEHGSARHYARTSGPRWLDRSWVEGFVRGVTGASCYDPLSYPHLSLETVTKGALEVVAERLDAKVMEWDPLDDLVRAAPLEVQRWMEFKAGLADGTAPALVLLSATTVRRIVAERVAGFPSDDSREQMEAGLLRMVCGHSFAEIGARLGASREIARRRCLRHMAALRESPRYLADATSIVRAALATDFPSTRRLFDAPIALAAPEFAPRGAATVTDPVR
jgi:REP element-mobilizing transposase RayT